MQEVQKNKQSSEVTRKALLIKLAEVNIEAEELGAEPQIFEDLDKIKGDIQSARVDGRRHRYFLKDERRRLERIRKTLNTLKESRRKRFLDDMKASIVLFLLLCIPYIIISKLYYLAHVPKHIPESSVYIYMIIGDILFDIWVALCIFLAIVYRYLTITYVNPFLREKSVSQDTNKTCQYLNPSSPLSTIAFPLRTALVSDLSPTLLGTFSGQCHQSGCRIFEF